MKSSVKRIIAREFLILIVVVIIVTLTWLIIYINSETTNKSYINATELIKKNETRLDSLKKNNPIPVPYEVLPLSNIVRTPKMLLVGWFKPEKRGNLILEYTSFKTHPDILNNPEDFFQARQNLIEIHYVIISTEDTVFYKNNRVFSDFMGNLNKDLLSKIYKKITEQSDDLPKKFTDFLTDIGYDTVTFKPIINTSAINYEKNYEKRITDCKNNITILTNEKIKIERSLSYNLDVKSSSIIVFLILFGLVYPLRGVLLMIKWSIKTLRNSDKNRN
jgi:hypothetical protein